MRPATAAAAAAAAAASTAASAATVAVTASTTAGAGAAAQAKSGKQRIKISCRGCLPGHDFDVPRGGSVWRARTGPNVPTGLLIERAC